MPKKSRRRRRERSKGRDSLPAAPPPAKRVETAPGISWAGLLGALLGFAPLFTLAVEILVDPPGVGRPFAAVPLLMASIYVPAIWASVARTERRKSILRASLVASLILPFTASFIFGSVILFVMLAPATALLWLALGGPRWRR